MSDQWAGIETLLEHGWPGEFTDPARAAYRILLVGLDPDQVLAALRSLVRKGGAFRPSAAEVAAAVAEDPSKPTFTEALSAIRRVVPVRPDEAALERAEAIHPYLGAFIRACTLQRLRTWEIDDPQWGWKERERLQQEWDRFVARADHRVSSGVEIDAPARRQLAGPRKPDFAGALPAGPTG
jgi:hypothetical protein